jgi:hypothetical protein
MDSKQPHPRVAMDKLFIGVTLIAIGIAGVLGALDLVRVRDIVRLWPLVLIAIGLGSEIEAIRHRREGGGWIFVALGAWLLTGSLHLFGLSLHEAMPVGIAVAGAGLVIHALTDKPVAKKENHDECQ